jgi:hypothetical protein
MDLPLVLVTWNDANVGTDDVVSLDNVASFHKPTVVSTLGWLLKADDEGVTIVNEFYDGYYRGRTFIYRPMIISITPYNLTKRRRPREAAPTTTIGSNGPVDDGST